MNSQLAEKKKEVEDEQEEDGGAVSSHLYLKPAGTLDKAVVLRRIRHRKRVNKLKSTLQSLVAPPPADGNQSSVPRIRWVDDAFAAP